LGGLSIQFVVSEKLRYIAPKPGAAAWLPIVNPANNEVP